MDTPSRFVAEVELGDGERAFLTALRHSSMRLYEVVDVVPGVSLTLKDVIEGNNPNYRDFAAKLAGESPEAAWMTRMREFVLPLEHLR